MTIESLAADSLSVRLGRVQALDDVSLTLRGGSVSLLAGPNGAGKTTFMKVLLGLVRPDAGGIELDGSPIPIDNRWKERIGYLPEAVAFSDNLSAQQLLGFFARARGVSRTRVDDVLEAVGLAPVGRRVVRGYSRGMRQRLGLGVAILAEPELLVLDEPTVGLDQEGLAVLWGVLDEWRSAGRIVLVSTHDLALTERRVDDIAILRSGKLVVQGSANDLRHKADLPHRVWLDVEGSEVDDIDRLHTALTDWGKGNVTRDGEQFAIELLPDAILELMKLQGDHSGVVRRLRVEEASLDMVYERLLEVQG
jgi:ABC-type multidrug transport system ATPase subunit